MLGGVNPLSSLPADGDAVVMTDQSTPTDAAGGPTAAGEQDPTRADAQMPSTEQLQEPSTEKEPGEEPKAEKPHDPEPSHHAVGIGVIGGPQSLPDGQDRPEEDGGAGGT